MANKRVFGNLRTTSGISVGFWFIFRNSGNALEEFCDVFGGVRVILGRVRVVIGMGPKASGYFWYIWMSSFDIAIRQLHCSEVISYLGCQFYSRLQSQGYLNA